jgi:hypothetical protein
MRQDSKQSLREQYSLSVPVIYFHITTWFERELAVSESIYLKIAQIFNSFNLNDPSWGRQFDSILSL